MPKNFLGGEMELDPALARDAMVQRIAEPLGYDGGDAAMRAAKGVLTIANLTMSSIIKKISIARGYDPRDFALFCYGGGGPLHGIELARALKIPRVIVPPEPGNFSAVGMLLADPRIDIARTFIVQLNPENLAKVTAIFGELESRRTRGVAARIRRRRGHDRSRSRNALQGPASFDQDPHRRDRRRRAAARALRPGIHAALRPRQLRRKSKIVVLHSLATLHTKQPEIARLARGKRNGKAPLLETRPIFFLEEDRFLPTEIYDRYALGADFAGRGPAVIVEYGSSTLIGPGDTFQDRHTRRDSH